MRYTGKALNAKSGAVLQTESGDYYIESMPEWSDEYYSRQVTVEGTLYEKKMISDPINEKGEIVQGAWGTQWVLKIEGEIQLSF